MLITTSRKPSQKTRTFGRTLERVLPSKYINRGKMSLREVFLKALEQNYSSVLVISEMKGNPSRLEFFRGQEKPELTLLISVDLSLPSGKINKDQLGFNCDDPPLRGVLKPVFDLKQPTDNYNLVQITVKNQKQIIEFYDSKGDLIKPRIYIKSYKIRDDSNGSTENS